jgi:hypothetical protein
VEVAKKLLDQGQNMAVLAYLVQCLRIWKHDSTRIGDWIDAIRAGKKPDFGRQGCYLNVPKLKMQLLIMFSDLLTDVTAENLDPSGTSLEEILAEYKRCAGLGEGNLDTGKN